MAVPTPVPHFDQHPGDNLDVTVATGSTAVNNHSSGSVIVTGLTTAQGTTFSQTISNNLVTSDSIIGVEVYSGTNTTVGLSVNEVTPGAGTFTVNVKNGHASNPLNGSVVIMFNIVT